MIKGWIRRLRGDSGAGKPSGDERAPELPLEPPPPAPAPTVVPIRAVVQEPESTPDMSKSAAARSPNLFGKLEKELEEKPIKAKATKPAAVSAEEEYDGSYIEVLELSLIHI